MKIKTDYTLNSNDKWIVCRITPSNILHKIKLKSFLMDSKISFCIQQDLSPPSLYVAVKDTSVLALYALEYPCETYMNAPWPAEMKFMMVYY